MSQDSDTITADKSTSDQLILDNINGVEPSVDALATAAHAGDSMSIIHLISQASLVVQIVMLILLFASVLSWSIIFIKHLALKRERNMTDQFEKEFWSGGSMPVLYEKWNDSSFEHSGMASMFLAGFTEYERWAENGMQNHAGDIINAVHRVMKVELGREIDALESNTSLLATIGSTSPYIGLLGTVWGIMNSFQSLGTSTQQATIASVAPGIAEALIATAMGLLAAIPAVIAYNSFSNSTEKLIGRYEIFMDEFLSLLNRELIVAQKENV